MSLHQFHPRISITSSHVRGDSSRFLTCMSSSPLQADLIEANKSIFGTVTPHPTSRIIAAASNPDHTIKLYFQNDTDNTLTFYGDLTGHSAPIHEVRFANHLEHPNILLSASEDNYIVAWDIRSRESIMHFKSKNSSQMFTCDIRGNTIAAGGEKGLSFYDIRSNALVSHSDTVHYGDVTQVRFHPTKNYLFSGSEDTLINVYDLSDPSKELEDCIDNTLPTEQTVAKFGFFGPNSEYLWCTSAVETLSLWNVDECEMMVNYNRNQFNEVLLSSIGVDREHFYHIADNDDEMASQNPLPTLPNSTSSQYTSTLAPTVASDWRIDNFLSCTYDQSSDSLYALAGTIGGGVVMTNITKNTISPYALLPPNTCHTSRIRDYLWNTPTTPSVTLDAFSLVTCSQDSRLALWTPQSITPQPLHSINGDVGGSSKAVSSRSKPRSDVLTRPDDKKSSKPKSKNPFASQ